MQQTDINPTKVYSKYEIQLLGVLGAVEPTVRKHILTDLAGSNIMQTKITGEGRERRYYVVGKNLISYIDQYGKKNISTKKDSVTS